MQHIIQTAAKNLHDTVYTAINLQPTEKAVVIDESQFETYVNALYYDANFYRPLGTALKQRLDTCEKVRVFCEGTELVYPVGMESSKLNIGDYTGMKNVGGTFPIGEVFTESKDLTKVNGAVKIF